MVLIVAIKICAAYFYFYKFTKNIQILLQKPDKSSSECLLLK